MDLKYPTSLLFTFVFAGFVLAAPIRIPIQTTDNQTPAIDYIEGAPASVGQGGPNVFPPADDMERANKRSPNGDLEVPTSVADSWDTPWPVRPRDGESDLGRGIKEPVVATTSTDLETQRDHAWARRDSSAHTSAKSRSSPMSPRSVPDWDNAETSEKTDDLLFWGDLDISVPGSSDGNVDVQTRF
ncbi:hypothetical protein BKA67DRAFT_421145 [Truncatella angustata]|uniref:Uncharacterized protein n=1 Tax=Truncatella angustata TaxID=152316 RepID=A0A9P8UD11_9PEZI|nr:uncharacterized protein BKA67DRAFT_421145 [Truncatella angustata]KAH6646955.1 hypothetical protein BKA67DRAFT_421145 [Truncatella angustata]